MKIDFLFYKKKNILLMIDKSLKNFKPLIKNLNFNGLVLSIHLIIHLKITNSIFLMKKR